MWSSLLKAMVGLSITVLISAISAAGGDSGKSVKVSEYIDLYDALVDMTPDIYAVADVQSFKIRRDAAEFDLIEGKLCLCRPIKGRVCGAYFFGKGVFSFIPPYDVEKNQLRRFYDTDTLYRQFEALYIIFGDSTGFELQQTLKFGEADPPENAGKVRGVTKRYMGDSKTKAFNPDLMKTFLDQRYNQAFYATIIPDIKKERGWFFKIDPFDHEQIMLYSTDLQGNGFDRELICSFPILNDNIQRDSSYYVNAYEIDGSFMSGLTAFSAFAKLQLVSTMPGQKWIYFVILPDLKVDSVFWGDGRPAEFFQADKSALIWIKCEPALGDQQANFLSFYYQGELIERLTYWFVLKTSLFWIPQSGDRQYSLFDITFHYPPEYTLVSVGDKVLDSTDKKMTTTRWVTREPIRNASFNIGYFESFKIEDSRIPTVTTLISEMGHREMEEFLIAMGELSGKDMKKQVGADVANSMALFREIYGDLSLQNFYASEVTSLGGEAFPGLIHLWFYNFQKTDDLGFARIMRAHEVAHQWWGIGVDYATYHDKWLSEGLAEYSSLLYLQWILKDNKKFFDHLKESRLSILENYKARNGDDNFAGPIWLGSRAGSSERGSSLILYHKGAWVVHMLRNMLIDLKTMNEDRFLNMMKDFYMSYRGTNATTTDFKKIAEKYAGENLDWFFSEWIYGTAIPKYKFSYKIEAGEDGKYIAHCRVKQSEVPPDFMMYLPMAINFGDGKMARIRVKIEGPQSDFSIPGLPLKPKDLKLNDLESVLCRVETEKWVD